MSKQKLKTIQIPEEMHRELKLEAYNQGVTITKILRERLGSKANVRSSSRSNKGTGAGSGTAENNS
jgi:hypothetical protein